MRFAILTEDLDLAIRTRGKMAQRYGGARMTRGRAETEEWGIAADWEVISYGQHWHKPPGDLIAWEESTEDSVAVVVNNDMILVDNPNRKEEQ